jgi:hypothetical protein
MAATPAQCRPAGILAAVWLVAACVLLPGVGHAQLEKVKATMAALIEETRKLGTPRVKGAYPVAGKSAPGLYFGRTRMNNSFDLVDALAKERGGVVILFVKAGNEFVRVATNVKKSDGSRAVGTILDPNSPAMAMIGRGEAYYGEATILGKPFFVGCQPIRDRTGNIIGLYYVGSVQ